MTKLPASGDPAAASWSVRLPGALSPIGLGVDGDGNVVLASSYYQALRFQNEGSPRLTTAAGSWSVFLGKLRSSDGSPVWLRSLGGPLPAAHDRWSALAVGPAGDSIVLAGKAGSQCGAASCIEKYASDGTLRWRVPLTLPGTPGPLPGDPRDAAVAADGSIYLTGRLTPADGTPRDAFVARFQASGALAWSSRVAAEPR